MIERWRARLAAAAGWLGALRSLWGFLIECDPPMRRRLRSPTATPSARPAVGPEAGGGRPRRAA